MRDGQERLQAHQRLQHLYEISTLLTGFESVERTVPAVAAILTRTLSVRSAIVVLSTQGNPRTIAWHEGGSARALHMAEIHARDAHGYLARYRSNLDEGVESNAKPGGPEGFIVLPLVAELRRVFGIVQVEGGGRLDEQDLIFLNAVVNQLAIALDRHRAAQEREIAAQERQIAAEAGQAAAGSCQAG